MNSLKGRCKNFLKFNKKYTNNVEKRIISIKIQVTKDKIQMMNKHKDRQSILVIKNK